MQNVIYHLGTYENMYVFKMPLIQSLASYDKGTVYIAYEIHFMLLAYVTE